MLHPEMNLNESIILKSLRIYEEYKKESQTILGEGILKRLLRSGEFRSASEYFDCLCIFYALGMLEEENGNMRFNKNDIN